MSQTNLSKDKKHQSNSISIQKLFFICSFIGGWYRYPLRFFMPILGGLAPILATYIRFLHVPLMLKQDNESIWDWVKRSCGHRIKSQRFWSGAIASAIVVFLPRLIDIVTFQGFFVFVSHSFSFYLFAIPSLIYLVLVQSFVEEWLFRRPLLKDNRRDIKDIFLSIMLFVLWHAQNPGVLSHGVLYFFMTFICLQYYIPVVITNFLDYSWGMHFMWNFLVYMMSGPTAIVKFMFSRPYFSLVSELYYNPMICAIWTSMAGFLALKDYSQEKSEVKPVKSVELDGRKLDTSDVDVNYSKDSSTRRDVSEQMMDNVTGWVPLLVSQ